MVKRKQILNVGDIVQFNRGYATEEKRIEEKLNAKLDYNRFYTIKKRVFKDRKFQGYVLEEQLTFVSDEKNLIHHSWIFKYVPNKKAKSYIIGIDFLRSRLNALVKEFKAQGLNINKELKNVKKK